MYEEKYELSLKKLLDAFTRFKRIGIVVGVLVMVFMVFGSKIIFPEQYEATALVKVKPEIAMIQDNNRQITRVVQEEILSRAVLESVVKKLELDKISPEKTSLQKLIEFATGKETVLKPYSMDNIIRDLRSGVTIIENVNDGNGTSLFTVSMRGGNPEEVSKIVNAVVETYIQQKTIYKANDTDQTVEFLKQRVDKKGEELVALTKKIEKFRSENGKFMASDSTINSALFSARLRLIQAQSGLEEAQARVRDIEETLNSIPKTLSGPSVVEGEIPFNPSERLLYMKRRLISLKATLTDTHPDVLRTKEEIINLEKAGVKVDEASITDEVSNPDYLDTRSALVSARAEERTASSEVIHITNEITDLERTLGRLPEIQETLVAMNTQKDAVTRDYDDLQDRLSVAATAAQAAKLKVGNSFTVLDPAVIPTAPLIRSRFILHMIGVFFGITAMLGVSILLGLLLPEVHFNRPTHIVYRTAFYGMVSCTVFATFAFVVIDFLRQTMIFV